MYMKKRERIAISILTLVSFIIIIFGIGYGIFVDINYFLFSKKTNSVILDNYRGKLNEPFVKIRYFDEFISSEVSKNVKLKRWNPEDYPIGSKVETHYIIMKNWVFIDGQEKPTKGMLVFKTVIMLFVCCGFYLTLKRGNWRLLNLAF